MSHELVESPINLEDLYDRSALDTELSEVEFSDGPVNESIYSRQMRDVHESRLDDRHDFLTSQQEMALAKKIKHGSDAEQILASGTKGKHKITLERLANDVELGKQAQNILAETNLRFGSYLARLSMNMLPNDIDDEDLHQTKTSTFGDITTLRSEDASLEDRIQIASLGLLKAAAKFRSRVSPKTGKVIRFTTFAAWYIHAELAREIPETEYRGMRLPNHAHSQYRQYRRGELQNLSEEKCKMFEYLAPILDSSISIDDDVLTNRYAEEEAEDDYREPQKLQIDEIVSAECEDTYGVEAETVYNLARSALGTILKGIPEREAGTVLHRFGFYDGHPETLAEVGEVYGVTRERIRQAESKALAKLRHPSRARHLVDFVDGFDETPKATSQIAGRHFGVTNIRLGNKAIANPAAAPNRENLESWQMYENESWDTPIYKKTKKAHLDHFLRQYVQAEYFFLSTPRRDLSDNEHVPHKLFNVIDDEHTHFSLDDIEQDIDRLLGPIGELMSKQPEHTLDGRKLGLFLSRIISESLESADDVISISIPEQLNGKIEMFGKGITLGRIEVNGDLGAYSGYKLGGFAHLHVKGNIGHSAGYLAEDMSVIESTGNAGGDLGRRTGNEVEFIIDGNVKSILLPKDYRANISCRDIRHRSPQQVAHSKQITFRSTKK